MNSTYVYAVQILFITAVAVGSEILNFEDKLQWLNVARYAIYIFTIRAVPEACKLSYQLHTRQLTVPGLLQALAAVRSQLALYLGLAALLVYFEQKLLNREFVFLFLGYLLVQLPDMAEAAESSISYGVGMACSFFEGYLVHVIPSDGANFVGFEENIRALEDDQGVCFPVKKLFIVITTSLYSPPDLKEFNKGRDRPYLEAFNSLRDVERSVAGVRNRIYRNTAYKIYRPGAGGPGGEGAGGAAGGPPVCLAAECATPLHTLHKVLNNRTLYAAVADIDVGRVVQEFCSTLQDILERSPQCRGKCELVHYNNDDPSQNLADILLERIRQLEPDFEQKILARRNENVLEEH